MLFIIILHWARKHVRVTAHHETRCGAINRITINSFLLLLWLVIIQGHFCADRPLFQVPTPTLVRLVYYFGPQYYATCEKILHFEKNLILKNWFWIFEGYVDQGSMAGSDWNGRGSVRMSTMKRTSIPSFATLHEVSNVDEAHHTDGEIYFYLPLKQFLTWLSIKIDVHLVPPLPELNVVSVDEIDLAALPPPPDFLLETAEEDGSHLVVAKETIIPERSLSVADAVKTLNEIRHQPASPGVVRRAQSMRATTDSSLHGRHPPPVLVKTLGTTPKRHSDHAHQTFTLTKNLIAKAMPANHNKTLPKQMPSHASVRNKLISIKLDLIIEYFF